MEGEQTERSTPISIGGSLLALGGEDKNGKTVSTVHLYQPDTGEWEKVGDLLTPRSNCTCTVIEDRKLFMAGGNNDGNLLVEVDMALIEK